MRKLKKTTAVRSRILSKPFFASFGGYFDRAYAICNVMSSADPKNEQLFTIPYQVYVPGIHVHAAFGTLRAFLSVVVEL